MADPTHKIKGYDHASGEYELEPLSGGSSIKVPSDQIDGDVTRMGVTQVTASKIRVVKRGSRWFGTDIRS